MVVLAQIVLRASSESANATASRYVIWKTVAEACQVPKLSFLLPRSTQAFFYCLVRASTYLRRQHVWRRISLPEHTHKNDNLLGFGLNMSPLAILPIGLRLRSGLEGIFLLLNSPGYRFVNLALSIM